MKPRVVCQAAGVVSAIKAKINGWQKSFTLLAISIAVGKRFGTDNAGKLAAVVAYYGFFSVFPLLLVAVTVLGFALEGRPGLREDLLGSAASEIPVIGEQIASSDGLSGNGLALGLGIATALWAGLAAMLAAQYAMNEVWGITRDERPNFVTARVRALIMLGVFGLMIIGSSAVAGLAGSLDGIPGITRLGLVAGNIAVNVLALLVGFQILVAHKVPWRDLLPGAVVSGVLYFVLQSLGTYIMRRYISNASDTYGTFAAVIGLLTWFHLLAQASILGAEVNVVTSRKLYPVDL